MARMTHTTGSCPVCGRQVARTVSTHAGLALEHYSCPQHGRLDVAPHDATVSEWAQPRNMPALSEYLQAPVPVGVEWIL